MMHSVQGPDDWRADSRSRSQHSPIELQGLQRSESFDEERAAAICAQISRDLLGDFAPALTLLPRAERRRVQALLAYARTLFDFARQPGLEGERLAQINRLEFDLELALTGHPPGQPAFVRMAGEERRRPWPRDGLTKLAAAARRTVLRERPARAAETEADARALAGAFLGSLLGPELDPALAALGGATLGVCQLQCRRGSESREAPLDRDLLSDLPRHYRHAALYAHLAARRLLHDRYDRTSEARSEAPRLSLPARLALLLRARWLGR